MQIVCAWCKKVTGKKEGEGISHTICRDCSIKYFDIDPMEKKPIMENPKKNPPVTTWHGIHKGMSAYWIIVDNEKFGPFTTKAEAEKEAKLFADVLKENSKLINKKNNNPKLKQYRIWYKDVLTSDKRSIVLKATSYDDAKGRAYDRFGSKIQVYEVESYGKVNNNPKKNPTNKTKLARELWDTSSYDDRVDVLIDLDFTESDTGKFANKKYTYDSAPIWVQKALVKYYTKK